MPSREHLSISKDYDIRQNQRRQVNVIQASSSIRALSTLIVIALILCAVIFGSLLSYMLVMSNYYNMPENTTLLIVEDCIFPIMDARYFNVTILNPSNSASDTNITAIRLTSEEKKEIYDINTTEPSLPFLLRRGTEQTFKCERNWSNFTGETVEVEPVAKTDLVTSYSHTLPNVTLTITSSFDYLQNVEYFYLDIRNSAESAINLTLSEILVFGISINENVTPALPYVLPVGEAEAFRCDWNWEDMIGENVTITAKTSEGYEKAYSTSKLLGAFVFIDDVRFDYNSGASFDMVFTSSEDSTADATITAIDLTLQDGEIVPINVTTPILGLETSTVRKNQSTEPFTCFWDWKMYRNKNITINAYTKEGFTIPGKTMKTPPTVIWNVTDAKFNLDATDHFTLNITNTPSSLQNISIAQVKFNEAEASFEPLTVPIGEEKVLNCTFDWKNFVGKNANITISTDDWLNISKAVTIHRVELKLLNMALSETHAADLNVSIPYVNITVSNSRNSLEDVTITGVIFETDNRTYNIDAALSYPRLMADGYNLIIGGNSTITCLWNWELLGASLKVTISTAEGYTTSRTWKVT